MADKGVMIYYRAGVEDFDYDTGFVKATDYEALRKRCEAVAADAARYRWLRKATPYRLKKLQNESIADASDVLYFLPDRFDAAIDQAIAAAQEPSHG